MSDADLLREAAQTLREKAEAVRRPYGPDARWHEAGEGDPDTYYEAWREDHRG